jgi:hypothetical protein
MAKKPTQEDQNTLSALQTEHFTLQGARNATISEANGRASLYMGSLSSALVALAFVAQISGMGETFLAFALVIFPTLLFLGIATYVRLLQTAMADILYLRGINRIRHFYTEIAPKSQPYFILSIFDDRSGVIDALGIKRSPWQGIFSISGVVATVNSVLAGVFAGLLASLLENQAIGFPLLIGFLTLAISFFLHLHNQQKTYARFLRNNKVLFPSDQDD